MSPSLVVNASIGTVAAVLTVVEFILSMIAAIAASAAVRGVWLMVLHRGGKASITAKSRNCRLVIRDFISFFVDVWLISSVAFIESKLKSTYVVTAETLLSSRCLRMDQSINPSLMDCLTPPLHLVPPPWVDDVAKGLGCKNGLSTVGLGELKKGNRGRHWFSAPVCEIQKTGLEDMKVDVRAVKICSGAFTVLHKGYDFFEIFPYWSPELISAQRSAVAIRDGNVSAFDVTPNHPSSQCRSRNINGPSLNMHTVWRSALADGKDLSNMIYYELCRLHGNKAVVTIPLSAEISCSQDATVFEQYDSGYIFDPTCIRDSATRMGIDGVSHTALLENISVQFHYDNGTRSFACLDAAVEVSYVFVSGAFVRRSGAETQDISASTIVPVSVAVLSGHCERTLNVLGRAALLFSADAEWRNPNISTKCRKVRYHGNMMSVTTSLFPLDEIKQDISGSKKIRKGIDDITDDPYFPDVRSARSQCHVRVVRQATEIMIDASFISLVIAAVVCALLVITGIGLRLTVWANGHLWQVGSAKWALEEIERLGANDLQVVVHGKKAVIQRRVLGTGLWPRREGCTCKCTCNAQSSFVLHHNEVGNPLVSISSLFRSEASVQSMTEEGYLGPRQTSTCTTSYELRFTPSHAV